MEYGLCCLFYKEQIKFKSYTYKNIKKLYDKNRDIAKNKILNVWKHNIETLQKAINYCRNNSIRSYRVSSDLLPQLDRIIDLDLISEVELDEIKNGLSSIDSSGLILSMHPGQHVNMGSPTEDVVRNSVVDLKNHFFVANLIGCREINIHIGGAYGKKEETKKRFIENMRKYLLQEELLLITIENDELNYSVKDVYEVVKELNIRLTYDIHHQRCHELKYKKDGEEDEYFLLARETWKNYSYQRLHISTPKDGYTTISKSRPHHDFIDKNDFPKWILKYSDVHIDIEAKAKEIAIKKLRKELQEYTS